jgi:L-rhamnose mutarotase
LCTGITNYTGISLHNKENQTIQYAEYQDIPAQFVAIDFPNIEIKFQEICEAQGKRANKQI